MEKMKTTIVFIFSCSLSWCILFFVSMDYSWRKLRKPHALVITVLIDCCGTHSNGSPARWPADRLLASPGPFHIFIFLFYLLSFGLMPTGLEIMCCSSMTYERGQFQNHHLPKIDTLHTSAFVNHNSASHCPPLSAYCACNTTIASSRDIEYEHICSRGRDYKIGGILDKSILKL